MSRTLQAQWEKAKAAIAELEREMVKQEREIAALKRHWSHGLDTERGRKNSQMLKDAAAEKENRVRLLKQAIEQEKERLRRLEERLRLGREV